MLWPVCLAECKLRPMNHDDVMREFREAGALLEGHFILSSGLHSPLFFQKAFVFMDPARTERLCAALAAKARAAFGAIDVVIAPALGAIIPGYETARALGARALFMEREDGKFRLRRGFAIAPEERVLLVEDVITTGLSVGECLEGLAAQRAQIAGIACLIDRSGGRTELSIPLIALAQIDAPTYRPDALPPELAALPAIKPGSRGLAP